MVNSIFLNKVYKKKISVISCVVLIFLLFCSIYLFCDYFSLVARFFSHKYLPYLSDEVAYFLYTKFFYLTSLLNAPLVMDGRVSVLLHSGFHGPFYQILYGTILKLFGFNDKAMVYINLGFFALSLAMVLFLYPGKLQRKIISVLLISSFCIPILFVLSYMVSSLHILFGVVLTFFLLQLSRNYKVSYEYMFIFSVLIFSLFRPTYLFWLAPLFLYHNRRKNIILFFIFISLCVLYFLYIQLICAHYPFSAVNWQLLLSGHYYKFIDMVFKNFTTNFICYFFTHKTTYVTYKITYLYAKYIVFFSFVLCAIFGFLKRSKLLLSASIIGFVNFFLLLLLYYSYAWLEFRFLASAYYLAVIAISFEVSEIVPLVLLLLQLSIFQHFRHESKEFIKKRINVATTYIKSHQKNIKAYQQIFRNFTARNQLAFEISDIGKPKSIWFSYGVFLPLQNKNKKPVVYFFNYIVDHVPYNISYNKDFKPLYKLIKLNRKRIIPNNVLAKNKYYAITPY